MNLEWADDGNSFELHKSKPVLAILTVEDDLQFFRGNRSNFADLLQTGKELGFITYVITTKDLRLTKPKVKGFAYSEETKTWHQRLFPLPGIIYNRIPFREDEIQPAVRRKLAAIKQHPDIHLFNPKFFDKWSLFEWLKLSKNTKSFIPSTRKLVTSAGLKRMLLKHPYLYLKPISGKAGVGIMTVLLEPEKIKPYRLKVQSKKRSVTYRCSSISSLWAKIKKQSVGASYIAQQGIELASFNDRRFDLRALVQKNRLGQWDLTGIGARVAGSSSITTHVPRGGSIEDPEKMLVSAFGSEQARKLFVRVKQTAVLIARQIERGSKSTLGEMSMDLGVDMGGNVWFFEANSKPMKFDEPHIRKKSLERIYHYGLYLNKQKLGKAGGA
ncbi:YheC/YheD family protein [Paenibacillus sp. GCM10012307]|uniref:YheC/YheD family protein n=1 Tax=Paenibacillus roseus TaxID=2798579 RepID=A0A934J5Q3_9BACL|nr:YheC/YheD family protein [Paenibacillus roseus]MBJ6362058.1 YheC/YheD family protein [Paenibacillus roseus]